MNHRYQIGFKHFLRDAFFSIMPDREFLRPLTRKLYKYEPDFIFLTHPRSTQDILESVSWISCLPKIIPKNLAISILKLFPCYVTSYIKWPEKNIVGIIVSTPYLPNELYSDRRLVSKAVKKISAFTHKISSKKVYVGLAAWWPIVTSGGEMFERHAVLNNRMIVTNGHCATIASLYLMIKRYAEIAKQEPSKLSILIIGIGKIGFGIAKKLCGEYGVVGILDKNHLRLKQCKNDLENNGSHIVGHELSTTLFTESVCEIMKTYDLVVCTTSNVGYIVDDPDKYRNCVVIDDSRPEAFRRVYSKDNNAVVLEGGILHIDGLYMNSDFGFGKRRNVFGCLGEAALLAYDKESKLKPSIGLLDYHTLDKFIDFISSNNAGVCVGQWKCGNLKIDDKDLASLIAKKFDLEPSNGIS